MTHFYSMSCQATPQKAQARPGSGRTSPAVGRVYAQVRCLVFKKQGADFDCVYLPARRRPGVWTKNEETTANRSRESQVLTADARVVLGFSVWSRLWKNNDGEQPIV
jgi:hypothetical protein